MSSQLLYKTRCPACAEQGKDRAGDNLGVYDDGHTYCFSCGTGTGGTVEGRLKTSKEVKPIPDLPEDVSLEIAPCARDWLLQYFDHTQQAPTHLWSGGEKKLIFPLFDEERMIAWQYRYFGDNPKHPKWIGYGITDKLVHIIGTVSNTLVLVEDLISAGKVGHITPAMPLFGSHIGLMRLARLKVLGVTDLLIWLDWDKRDYSIKAGNLANSIGLEAHIVLTKHDPKEYSFTQIRELVLE